MTGFQVCANRQEPSVQSSLTLDEHSCELFFLLYENTRIIAVSHYAWQPGDFIIFKYCSDFRDTSGMGTPFVTEHSIVVYSPHFPSVVCLH